MSGIDIRMWRKAVGSGYRGRGFLIESGQLWAMLDEIERLRMALRDIASVSVVEVHYGREMLGIRTNDGMALVSIEEDTADALRGKSRL